MLQCPARRNPAEVRKYLDEFAKGSKQDDAQDLMLECRALWFLGASDDAIARARLAFKSCGQDANCLERWFHQETYTVSIRCPRSST